MATAEDLGGMVRAASMARWEVVEEREVIS